MSLLAWVVFTAIVITAIVFLICMVLIEEDPPAEPGTDEIWNELESLKDDE